MKSILVMLFSFASAAPAFAEQPVCISKPRVNLRAGPGTNFPVSWKVSQNMPFLKVGAKGSWVQVEDVDGQRHWVMASMVSSRITCAVIRTKSAPLKKGPGNKFPTAELSRADHYTPFKKIDRDGAWVLLEDEYRSTYWVHESKVWIPVIRSAISF